MIHLNQQSKSLHVNDQSEQSHLKVRKNINLQLQNGGWKRLSKMRSSPSATFGKSQRNSAQKSDGPGPGCYNIDLPISEKHMISLKGSRLMRYNTDIPGPAKYDIPNTFSSKKYSFPRSSTAIISQIRPSPSAYTINSPDKPKAITFSKEKRRSMVDQSKVTLPGPGNYSTDKKQTHNQCSFTKSRKFLENQREYQEKKLIPGPGNYEIGKNRHKMQSYKFTQALKTLGVRQKTPGPGTYNGQKSTLSHQGGIICQQKKQFDYRNSVPGPGNYKQVSVESFKNREPRAVFTRAKGKLLRVATEAGPGAYFRNQSNQKIPGGVIGRDRRSSIANPSAPSALDYSPNYDEVLSKAIKVAFGREQRSHNLKTSTPGPGDYNLDRSKSVFGKSNHRVNKTQLSRKPRNRGRSVNVTSLSNK